jgi:hypothetical protein
MPPAAARFRRRWTALAGLLLVGLPGQPGTLALDDRLALDAGSVYQVDLGLGERRRHDRLRVAGGVRLDGARLRLVGRRPAAGQAFTILDNLGDGPVRGSFRGLREGATVGGRDRDGRPGRFRVTYRGGDGNDVVLRSLRWSTAATRAWPTCRTSP